jgi:hypothetical protein
VTGVLLLVLLVVLAGVSSADAHAPPTEVAGAEAVSPNPAQASCCHDAHDEASTMACVASACCPASSGVQSAAFAMLPKEGGAISAPRRILPRGQSILPPLHPPISA